MTDSPSLLSYGAEAAVVQSLPGADIELAPGFSVAMVRFAARYEYARTVEDVLARRTRLLFLDARLAEQLSAAVAETLQERSEEHRSELQSLMRISYAVFCLNNRMLYYKNKHNYYSRR